MTVLVYRAGVLASDSMMSDNGTSCGTVRKLARGPGGTIAGACGSCGMSRRFLSWIEMGEPGEFDPDGAHFSALIVRPGGEVLRMSAGGGLWEVDAPFHTDGSGSDIAMGALEVGATAVQAVEAAIKWDVHCGGPIQIERLVCSERRRVVVRLRG